MLTESEYSIGLTPSRSLRKLGLSAAIALLTVFIWLIAQKQPVAAALIGVAAACIGYLYVQVTISIRTVWLSQNAKLRINSEWLTISETSLMLPYLLILQLSDGTRLVLVYDMLKRRDYRRLSRVLTGKRLGKLSS